MFNDNNQQFKYNTQYKYDRQCDEQTQQYYHFQNFDNN